MFKKMLMAALMVSAAAISAQASTGPRVVDEAQSRTVIYDMPSANIVGSANAVVTGGMENRTYETLRVLRTQRADAMYGFGVNQNWQLRVDSNS